MGLPGPTAYPGSPDPKEDDRLTEGISEPASMWSSAMSGGRWGAIRSVVLQVLNIATTAVLARLLVPEDFGLVAITVLVLTMFELVTRVGFGASVIRRQPLTVEMTSTFFWASLGLGLIVGGAAAIFARPAAALAGSVDAAPLVLLAAVTLPINLAGRVPSALLSRELRFRATAALEIGGSLIHTLVAVALAYLGLGALAVVVGQVCRSVYTLVASFVLSQFKPTWTFDREVIAEDLGFNTGWLGADLVTYANKNVDYWFVGNTMGPHSLGVYYVAFVIPNLLRMRVSMIGHDVLYPVASRIQDDLPRIVAAYLRVVRLVTFMVAPAMLGLAIIADLAVRIGFGPDWGDAVGPLRVIAIAAVITSVTVVANPLFGALGRPGILVTTGLATLAALSVGLAVSRSFGSLVAVATAVLIAALVEAVVVISRLRPFIGMRLGDLLSSTVPFLASAVVMAVAVWALRVYVIGDMHVVVQAIIAVAAGAVVYLGVGWLLFRSIFAEQLRATRSMAVPGR